MFNGCANLNDVKVAEPSDSELSNGNAFMGIQDRAFFGCNSLSKITFPRGVTTLNAFDEYSLYGSSLSRITLNGVSRDELLKYSALSSSNPTQAVFSTDGLEFGKIYEVSKDAQVMEVFGTAMKNNLPIMVIACWNGCSMCATYKKNVLNTDRFQEFLSQQKLIVIYGGGHGEWHHVNLMYYGMSTAQYAAKGKNSTAIKKKTIENYKDPENDSSDGTVYGSYVSYSESSGAKISDK